MAIINVAVMDAALSVSQILPAAGANVTTPIIDMQAVAPNSNAWRLGRFQVSVPAIPENTAGAGITVTMWAAPPLLTGGASAIAPLQPAPGAFVNTGNVVIIPAVAAIGSPAQSQWFTLEFDPTGSTYQFYEFVIATPAQINPNAEQITIGWING